METDRKDGAELGGSRHLSSMQHKHQRGDQGLKVGQHHNGKEEESLMGQQLRRDLHILINTTNTNLAKPKLLLVKILPGTLTVSPTRLLLEIVGLQGREIR